MKKNSAYNHTSFRQRLAASIQLLKRAQNRGPVHPLALLTTVSFWRLLVITKPLDGSRHFRQSLARIVIPKYINSTRARTILLISQR